MVIISITGTKGKTSTARLLDFVIRSMGNKTLRVDSDGHFINGEKKSSYFDSTKLFGNHAPTVCPGKYLISMKDFFPDFFAIMESSIGCGRDGLGYEFHQVGIFSNIFNDHITGQKNRRSRKDLAREKSFIFYKTAPDGCIVFNADDRNITNELERFRPQIGKRKILPIGISFKHFDIDSHLSSGGIAITIENGFFIIKSKEYSKKIFEIKDLGWIVDPSFEPFIYNCLLSLGCLVSLYGENIPKAALDAILKYKVDSEGGRMVFLKSQKGTDIIFDYAHERQSLLALAKLARKISNGKLLGVLRIAPNNRNKEIMRISRAIAPLFDEIFVYDKIDGKHRGEYVEKGSGFVRKIGETSEIFSKDLAIASNKVKINKFIFEEDAVRQAAEAAREGDMLVAIWGDNKKRSLGYLKKYFHC